MNPKNTKPFVKPLSEAAMRRQIAKLVREGKLPTIEELASACLEAREAYRLEILRARRQSQRKVVN